MTVKCLKVETTGLENNLHSNKPMAQIQYQKGFTTQGHVPVYTTVDMKMMNMTKLNHRYTPVSCQAHSEAKPQPNQRKLLQG